MSASTSVVGDAYYGTPSVDPRPSSDFIFMSSHQSIQARGVFDRITLPASDGAQANSQFQNTVTEALRRATLSGIEKPIVIGALPFDVEQPSCLYIPQHYECFDRDARLAEIPQLQASEIPVSGFRCIPDEHRFKQGVKQAIANFQLSDIRKAVLSRVLELQLHGAVDVDRIFSTLVAQNPTGYNFRVPMENGAELMGASPELLIRKQGNRIVSNPLAGSARRESDSEHDREVSERLTQSSKDTHEHRLVIEEIRQSLEPYCSELYIPQTPSLFSTPTMWHLSTFIEGQLEQEDTTALQLACRLHPTPAVCGFPTSLARKLINLVEPFERGLFTGTVGWCDAEGNGEWVVTIRCGTIAENCIRLFAGAGIVEASCPESEWQETQAKLQTMLRALGINIDMDAL
jgi:isochorismate synthase